MVTIETRKADCIKDSNIGLVYCRQKVIDEVKKTETINMRKCYSGEVFDKLIEGNFIGSTRSYSLKKECFDECGLFDVRMKSAQIMKCNRIADVQIMWMNL